MVAPLHDVARHLGGVRPAVDLSLIHISLPAVTVHARGADENAKDLPYTVEVIDGITLEQRRLLNVEQVLRATPGVNVNSSGGANVSTIYIRGVGALYPMSMDDSSVAPVSYTHLDVYKRQTRTTSACSM